MSTSTDFSFRAASHSHRIRNPIFPKQCRLAINTIGLITSVCISTVVAISLIRTGSMDAAFAGGGLAALIGGYIFSVWTGELSGELMGMLSKKRVSDLSPESRNKTVCLLITSLFETMVSIGSVAAGVIALTYGLRNEVNPLTIGIVTGVVACKTFMSATAGYLCQTCY